MTVKKLDVRKVEAALKRAAKVAVSGPREAQSGRFTGDKLPRQKPSVRDDRLPQAKGRAERDDRA